jgi:rare lipoprotein A (peptidoglycan hydrolase)
LLCGALFGIPLLLLQNGPATASRASTESLVVHVGHKAVVYPASHLDGVDLSSHLVAYQAPATSTTTTTTPPVTTTTAAPVEETTTPTTEAPRVVVAPPPVETTTTTEAAAALAATEHEVGQATWYAEAPPGMCASPTLPFGTVLTVTNNATGASTVCRVDDREGAGYPRVVDMSPEGFSQIADISQGVVDVTISW